MNDKAVCRTAPATPGLVVSLSFYSFSNVVVGRENGDQPLDGGGNTLPNGYVSRGE